MEILLRSRSQCIHGVHLYTAITTYLQSIIPIISLQYMYLFVFELYPFLFVIF